MKTEKTFNQAEISKENLENIKSGSNVVIITCPVCGGVDWEITSEGNSTQMRCSACGKTYNYPTFK